MMRPFVARVVRNRSPGMAMGDETTFNPFVTDVTIDKRIENQISRLYRFPNIKNFLLPWIVDLEDDVGMIQRHMVGNPL